MKRKWHLRSLTRLASRKSIKNLDSIGGLHKHGFFFFFFDSFFLCPPPLSVPPHEKLGGKVGQEMVSFRSLSFPAVNRGFPTVVWFSNVFHVPCLSTPTITLCQCCISEVMRVV